MKLPPPSRASGEGGARGGVDRVEVGRIREHRAGHDEAQVAGVGDRDRGDIGAGLLGARGDVLESRLGVFHARGHDFQRERGAEPRAHGLETGQCRRAVAVARIQIATQETRRERRERGPGLKRDRRIPGLDGHGELGQPALRAADTDRNRCRAAGSSSRLRRARKTYRHRLFDSLPAHQGIGVGQAERAHVGLVGSVGPVALVLHLEGVALHGAGHFEAGANLVADRADIHDRLLGVDALGKAGLYDAAVDVFDLGRESADAGHRMQDHETGSVGQEVGDRAARALEAQGAVGAAGDFRRVAKRLGLVHCTRRRR